MVLKQCIEILLEEMKRIDALTEADMQAYAGFLANIENHTANITRRKRELATFEKMFGALAEPAVYGDQSRHVGLLNNMIAEEQTKLAENNERIDERKDYYEQLAAKNHRKLWQLGDERSRLAALYFAYSAGISDISEMSKLHLSDAETFTEAVAKYLIIKVIIAYENKNENPNEELVELYKLARKFGEGKEDEIWKNCITALRIYQARLCLETCNAIIDRNTKALDRHKSALEAYESESDRIKSQIRELESAKGDREVREEVKKVRDWYEEQTKEWKQILPNIMSAKQKIQGHQEELLEDRKHFEKAQSGSIGMPQEAERTARIKLEEIEKSCASVRESLYVEAEKRKKELLSGLQEALKPVQTAQNNEVARKKEEARQEALRKEQRRERSEERRRNRPANLRTGIACLFVVFTMLLGPIGVNALYPVAISSPRAVPFTASRYVYYNAKGPVVFGLGFTKYLTVNILTDEMPKITTPFIHQQKWIINNENIKQIDVPDEVDVLYVNKEDINRESLNWDTQYLSISTNDIVKQINVSRMTEQMSILFDGRISFVEDNNSEYAYIDGEASLHCVINEYGQNSIQLYGPQVMVHNVSLPDVTVIEAWEGVERMCITDCDTVTDIIIPVGVKYVEIRNCDNLVNIYWREGIDMSQVEVHIGDNGSNVAVEEGM